MVIMNLPPTKSLSEVSAALITCFDVMVLCRHLVVVCLVHGFSNYIGSFLVYKLFFCCVFDIIYYINTE